MLQIHTDFEQAESERLSQAQAEIDRLTQALQDIYRCAYQWEWHSYSVDTPEGYVYRRSKEVIDNG